MSRPTSASAVALRDRTTGRYLVAGGEWCDDPAAALLLHHDDAADVRRRFSCEPPAIEVVDGVPRDRAVA